MADELARQLIDVPFTGGVSTRVDKYQIPFNKLAAAKNVIFSSPGEIRTRYGYRALTRRIAGINRFGNDAITAGQGLLAYGNELVMCDPHNIYSYDPGSERWIYKGPCSSVNIQSVDVAKNAHGQRAPDQNISANGLRFDAWEDGALGTGGVYYSVTNKETGTTVIPATLVSAVGVKPKVLTIGNKFALLYIRTDTDRIYLAACPTANVFGGLTTNPITSASTAANQLYPTIQSYDATVIPNTAGGPILYVAFNNNSTSRGITTFGFAPNNLITPAYVAAESGKASQSLTVFADTIAPGVNSINGPVVAYATSADVFVYAYQWSLAASTMTQTSISTVGGAIVNITGASSSDNQSRTLDVFWTRYNATSWKTDTRYSRVSGATPTITGPTTLYGSVGLASKAFPQTGGGQTVTYVVLAYESTFPTAPGFGGLQDTYFVGDSTGYAMGRFFCGTAGALPTYVSGSAYAYPMLPEVSAESATLFHVALMDAEFLTTVGAVGEPPTASTFSRTTAAPGTQAPLFAVFTQDGVVAVSFDFFDSQNSYLSAELGGTLLLGGGLLQGYDGQTLTENDFSLAPENISLAQSNTASGALTLLGTYWYAFCWEWTNARGEIQRSAPSVPISITLTGSNDTVTATVPALHMTNKTGVVLMGYRSIANVGTVYHQTISTTIPAATNGTNAPILNDKTAQTIALVDVLSDTLLASTPVLYTTGLVIENLPTQACSDLTVNYNRLFALSTEQENVIFFSQQTGPGEPVQMSQWLGFNVDPRGGRATAIRALDQHLIVFKENLIMAIDGTGPNAIGQGGFQEAYIVTSDVGCIYPRSIGMGKDGLYFETAKGIYLLDRSLTVHDDGSEAQALVNPYEVSSAVLVPYTQQMRFTMSNQTLVGLDYFTASDGVSGRNPGQWFEHTDIDGVDAAIWLAQYTYLRPNGVVMVETPPMPGMSVAEAMATYSDAGAFFGMSIESPWFPFSGLNGWARTWWAFLLGKVMSRCTLRVDVSFDQDPSVKQSVYIEAGPGGIYGVATYGQGVYGGGFPDSVWRIQPRQELSNAIKFTVTVLQADGVIGESVSLSGFSFEYGSAKTARRPNTSATYG